MHGEGLVTSPSTFCFAKACAKVNTARPSFREMEFRVHSAHLLERPAHVAADLRTQATRTPDLQSDLNATPIPNSLTSTRHCG